MKTLMAVILTTSLLASVSVTANDKVAVKATTDFMVEYNSQQVKAQLTNQLTEDIQFSLLAMKTPSLQLNTDNQGTLVAKAAVKPESKSLSSDE